MTVEYPDLAKQLRASGADDFEVLAELQKRGCSPAEAQALVTATALLARPRPRRRQVPTGVLLMGGGFGFVISAMLSMVALFAKGTPFQGPVQAVVALSLMAGSVVMMVRGMRRGS